MLPLIHAGGSFIPLAVGVLPFHVPLRGNCSHVYLVSLSGFRLGCFTGIAVLGVNLAESTCHERNHHGHDIEFQSNSFFSSR